MAGLRRDCPGGYGSRNNSFLKNLCTLTNRSTLVKPTSIVCGLGGTELPIIGETEIAVTDAGPVRVGDSVIVLVEGMKSFLQASLGC